MTLEKYLGGEETLRRQELAYGFVREPPSPTFGHQLVVGRVYSRLERHVSRCTDGRLVVSPIDVVLDSENALVVQPDIVFVSGPRLGICADRIWGAPDLVIEVLSTATRRHDCTVKQTWYRRYGVRECWFVDPISCEIEVIDLEAGPDQGARTFDRHGVVLSRVLPRLRFRVSAAFMGGSDVSSI